MPPVSEDYSTKNGKEGHLPTDQLVKRTFFQEKIGKPIVNLISSCWPKSYDTGATGAYDYITNFSVPRSARRLKRIAQQMSEENDNRGFKRKSNRKRNSNRKPR